MTTDRLPDRRTGLIGGLLLWFGVLGGALAWTVHALAAWSIDELACAAGSSEVAGMPLRYVIGMTVLIPAAAAVAALAVTCLAWRRTEPGRAGRWRTSQDAGSPRAGTVGHALGRARMLALVGLASNLLFLTIIVLGGVATLVFPPCQR